MVKIITIVLLINRDGNTYNDCGVIISAPFKKIVVSEDKFAEFTLNIYKVSDGYAYGVSVNAPNSGYGWGGSRQRVMQTMRRIVEVEVFQAIKHIDEYSHPKKNAFIKKLQNILTDETLS